jgi:ribonuclease BN (tRNA processing enzyme)
VIPNSPIITPRLYQIGTGTCRVDAGCAQSSACIINGDTTFLVDIGYGVLNRLDSLGALEHCRELHIHISHRHTDHLAGLFPLLQCLTWSDDLRHLSVERVVIHATEEVCGLIGSIRALWGEDETSLRTPTFTDTKRSLEYRPGPNFQNWTYAVGEIQVASVHLPGANNHGAKCEIRGRRYAFTCDATEVNDSLVDFCRNSDICVFDFGHLTNTRDTDGTHVIDLHPVAELLARANPRDARAAHVYLRHMQDRYLSASERSAETLRLVTEAATLARQRGFSGALTLAVDNQPLTL